MIYLFFILPIVIWFIFLGLFLIILRKEHPKKYDELNIFYSLFKGRQEDAIKIISFFWQQEHQSLGGQTASAGKALNIIFLLICIVYVCIFWLGASGKLV